MNRCDTFAYADSCFPQRAPAVVTAIGGGERDPQTPVSMVGASRLGGEAAQLGLWPVFLLMPASLNLFMAVFNLLPRSGSRRAAAELGQVHMRVVPSAADE